MGILYLLLSVLAGLAGLACWIITLIKIFQSDDGIPHGVIGILCGLWAFIYGWIKVDEMDNRKVMIIWSIAIVLSIILNVLFRVFMMQASISREPFLYNIS